MSDIYFKFAVNIMYSHTLKFITSTDEAPSLQIERSANINLLRVSTEINLNCW